MYTYVQCVQRAVLVHIPASQQVAKGVMGLQSRHPTACFDRRDLFVG